VGIGKKTRTQEGGRGAWALFASPTRKWKGVNNADSGSQQVNSVPNSGAAGAFYGGSKIAGGWREWASQAQILAGGLIIYWLTPENDIGSI